MTSTLGVATCPLTWADVSAADITTDVTRGSKTNPYLATRAACSGVPSAGPVCWYREVTASTGKGADGFDGCGGDGLSQPCVLRTRSM